MAAELIATLSAPSANSLRMSAILDPAADRDRTEQRFAELPDLFEPRCLSRHVQDDKLIDVPAFKQPDPVFDRAYAARVISEGLASDASGVMPEKCWNDSAFDAHSTTGLLVNRS
jgi:hypothetical protein